VTARRATSPRSWRTSVLIARPGTTGGFTLLEVILALSMVVVLAGMVYAFYHDALGVRETVARQSNTALAQRRVLDMIDEDLRSALLFSTLQVGLDGRADGFAVARTAVPSRAVFVAPSIGSVGVERGDGQDDTGAAFRPQTDVQLVEYRLRIEEDEDGVEYIAGLERTCQRTVMAETAEQGQEIQAVLLSAAIKFLRTQYWDGQAWAASWQENSLPTAVRVDVGLEPLDEDLTPEEYPHETMWRVIAIPSGGAARSQRRASVTRTDAGGDVGGGGR